jgi:ketosteroid isomerase-like protein
LAAKYDTAFNKNDPAAIATLYTQDGVHGFHRTIHGREAIEKWYAHEFQSWHPNKRFTAVGRVGLVGNEVRSTGRWSATYDDWGTPTSHAGYYSWTIVREGDTWKIRRESISESNPWSVN